MAISRPILPPKRGYVEVEIDGKRTYKNIDTGVLIDDELIPHKEAEISAACKTAITSGVDVETSQGKEHFSLEETDQINLTTAFNAIQQGVTMYPYHSDGNMCRMFTADEIVAISNASIQHKLYHTTLCNHLLTWVRRSKDVEEINNITYSAENLPEDLAANMASILAMAASM